MPVYQGPRWVQIREKTGGRKSRDTLPLKTAQNIKYVFFKVWKSVKIDCLH